MEGVLFFTSGPFQNSSWRPGSYPGLRTTFGLPHTNISITLASPNLKCVDPTGSGSMQTWPRHSPVNNQQRDLDTHVGSHMFHDDLIGWTTTSRIQVIPYTIPFVNRYVTCPRPDRRYPNTLFNLVTGKSLYSFHNTSSRDQLLDHTELIMMMHYRVGPEIPLRHTEWQIPVSIHVNPTDTFGDTCSIPLWSPSYVVTFGTPKALLRYPGVTWSHGLRKWYLTLEKL